MEPPTQELSLLNRQDLYDRVWASPTTRLAVEFGVKPQFLAKLCDEMQVPRPSSGYWTHVRMGMSVEKTPLPELDDDSLAEVQTFRQQFFAVTTTAVDAAASPKSAICVPATLQQPHAMIRTSQRYLKKIKPGADHVLTPDTKESLDIRVTKLSLDRALCIFDTFIKHWESLGGSVHIGSKNNRNDAITQLELHSDRVQVEMSEVVRRVASKSDPSRWWRYREFKYEPTGQLFLKLDAFFENRRTKWADGKQQRLENLLDSFTRGAIALLDACRERRLEQECCARQEAAARENRLAAERKKKQHEERRESLMRNVRAHREAEEIRQYLSDLQTRIDNGQPQAIDPSEFAEWMEWARCHADTIDPLTATSSRCELALPPRNVPINELDLTRAGRAVIDQLSVNDTDELYAVSQDVVCPLCKHWDKQEWDEICRILEGYGYNVNGRYRSDRYRVHRS